MSFRTTLLGLSLAAATLAACAPTYVVVPERRDGYSERDTLRGRLKGRDVRVTFAHVTVQRVDTVTRWRTIYRDGGRVDTVVVVDTVRTGGGRRPFGPRVDTVYVVDTVLVGPGRRPIRPRVDTVRIVVRDTIRITEPGSPRPNTPGGPIIMPPRPADARVDTVRIVVRDTVYVNRPGTPNTPGGPIIMPPRPAEDRVDTVRVVVRDTVRITVRDTVRIPGRRTLFVPPGHYPPAGQCRVWIHDQPPGQQAEPAACNALGTIPPGAFVLFNQQAWDADYDYASDPTMRNVPPEILALRRRSGAPAPTRPGGLRPTPRPRG
jgi:hypothetical protein